jgi:hypothetical protein
MLKIVEVEKVGRHAHDESAGVLRILANGAGVTNRAVDIGAVQTQAAALGDPNGEIPLLPVRMPLVDKSEGFVSFAREFASFCRAVFAALVLRDAVEIIGRHPVTRHFF